MPNYPMRITKGRRRRRRRCRATGLINCNLIEWNSKNEHILHSICNWPLIALCRCFSLPDAPFSINNNGFQLTFVESQNPGNKRARFNENEVSLCVYASARVFSRFLSVLSADRLQQALFDKTEILEKRKPNLKLEFNNKIVEISRWKQSLIRALIVIWFVEL